MVNTHPHVLCQVTSIMSYGTLRINDIQKNLCFSNIPVKSINYLGKFTVLSITHTAPAVQYDSNMSRILSLKWIIVCA
jgi:hypothetical protein